jgi:hypothetical protein
VKFASPADRSDAAAFLSRVARLDPGALVRVRSSGGALTLWAWLPLEALVARSVRGDGDPDVTVPAKALLDAVAGGETPVPVPPRRDEGWRGALPPDGPGEHLDEIPADVVDRLLAAAEQTFRAASTGADPQAVGDALLDHEVLSVSGGGHTVAVPLRALLAGARMGFLGTGPLRIAVIGAWVGIRADFGAVYLRRGGGLALFPGGR